jgi:hypothetical protein
MTFGLGSLSEAEANAAQSGARLGFVLVTVMLLSPHQHSLASVLESLNF